MFDVAINNCFIPDFERNIFIKASVSIRENLISYNTLNHYGLNIYSQVKEGSFANLVLFKDFKEFEICKVIVNGKIIDNFNTKQKRFSKAFLNS